MTSLLDIGPLSEEVKIGKDLVTVHGVTPEGFFCLLDKFPVLQQMLNKKASVDIDVLQESAPGCISYAIALSATDRSEYSTKKEWLVDVEKAAKKAVNLPAVYQMAMFQAALRLTFPDGVGPFMQAVTELAGSIRRVTGKTAPDMTSSKPSRSGFVVEGSRGMRLGQGAPRENSVH